MSRRNSTRTLIEALESRTLLTASPYDNRGWVSIIVDHTIAQSIAPKLAQFKKDLIGDGWRIAPDQEGFLSHSNAPRMDDQRYIWDNTAGHIRDSHLFCERFAHPPPVNFDDYVLIDIAFNTQDGALTRNPGRGGIPGRL